MDKQKVLLIFDEFLFLILLAELHEYRMRLLSLWKAEAFFLDGYGNKSFVLFGDAFSNPKAIP